MLVRQFQCLSDALTDPCPLVRVAAAQGICTILNLYWEIIPSATTAGYVSRLTGGICWCTLTSLRLRRLGSCKWKHISKAQLSSHCWCADLPERKRLACWTAHTANAER
jgi:hypothetical protein